MSRIGKKPIAIPEKVTIDITEATIVTKGPLGEDRLNVVEGIAVEVKDGVIRVVTKNDTEGSKKIAGLFGLYRTLINNMIIGVTKGFEKNLEIIGVGYRAAQKEEKVQFQLGYSHEIIFTPPQGIKVEVLDPTKLRVKGINKEKVGQVAANIRGLRPPEPYKGKGIRYKDEIVRKKAGKTGK